MYLLSNVLLSIPNARLANLTVTFVGEEFFVHRSGHLCGLMIIKVHR